MAAAAFQTAQRPSSDNNLIMRHYQRRLLHWDVVGQRLFVTFRLQGNLPAHRVFPPGNLADSGKAFVVMDRLLDRSNARPVCLRRGEIAEMIVAALREGDQRFACMPLS
jgi:hypothetical protein